MTLKSDANDLRLQIWHEEFGEISPNDSKVWKFVFDGLFVSKSVQGLSYKNTEDLTFMTLNKWSKIWINLDLQKMAWGTRWTLIRALKSLKNGTLMGSFCPKHIMIQQENFMGIMCHYTEGGCKTKGKLTHGLKNDIKKFEEFFMRAV